MLKIALLILLMLVAIPATMLIIAVCKVAAWADNNVQRGSCGGYHIATRQSNNS